MYFCQLSVWPCLDFGCKINVFSFFFCSGLPENILRTIYMMAVRWNEGTCIVVDDRTPQSLMNSSSLIWADPPRALTGLFDTCTRCRAHSCCSNRGRIWQNGCSQEKKVPLCCNTDNAMSHGLCVWALHPLFERSINCIWCKCFPNQACCLEQTCWLRRIAVKFETNQLYSYFFYHST